MREKCKEINLLMSFINMLILFASSLRQQLVLGLYFWLVVEIQLFTRTFLKEVF